MPQRGRTAPGSKDRGAKERAAKSRGPKPKDDRQALEALEASDKLYYRIGEVSELTGVKAHVLRYWETEFRWMAPPKSRSKQRLYRKRDIELILLLKRLLWDERYTIAGARQRIQELGVDEALSLLTQPAGVDAAHPPAATTESGVLGDLGTSLGELRDELLSLRTMLLEEGAS